MHTISPEHQQLGRLLRELDQTAREPLPERIAELATELAKMFDGSNLCPNCGSKRTLICPVCDPYEVPP